MNRRKHGVAFAETFAVFEDPNAPTRDDDEHGEERYVTMGMDCLGRLLVIVHMWRDENIRVISARAANKSEVRQYES
jgi:uncharacterized protein